VTKTLQMSTSTDSCSTTADPRAGRLVADDEGAHAVGEADDLVAHDAGIDGGAATAEEAAVHIVEDDDHDVRSGD